MSRFGTANLFHNGRPHPPVSHTIVTIQCQHPAANNNYWFLAILDTPNPRSNHLGPPQHQKHLDKELLPNSSLPCPQLHRHQISIRPFLTGKEKKPFSILTFTPVKQFGTALRSKHFKNLFWSQVWHEKRTPSCTLSPRYSWCLVSAGRDFRHTVSPHRNGFFETISPSSYTQTDPRCLSSERKCYAISCKATKGMAGEGQR